MNFHMYVIFHKFLLEKCYEGLHEEHKKKITFVAVNEAVEKHVPSSLTPYVFHETQFPLYDPSMQQDKFCESSVWFHLFLNPELSVNLFDFVGCFHYDMKLSNEFFEYIQTVLTVDHPGDIDIVFYFQLEYGLEHFGSVVYKGGKENMETFTHSHWYSVVVAYNKVFHTNHEYRDLVHDVFPGFHSFILHKSLFMKIAKFASHCLPWIKEQLKNNMQHMPYTLETLWGLLLILQKRENPRLKFVKLRGITHDEALKDDWKDSLTLTA